MAHQSGNYQSGGNGAVRITVIIVLLLLCSPLYADDYVLAWKDNSDNEDGFVVLERIGGGNQPWKVLVVVLPNVTTITRTIPNDGTRYCWVVQSYSFAGGAAEPSNTVCQRG